ncbi:MAG: hypothetical protein A2W99_14170 [Bacteroidetes bacterium GWF2_33_16]|nr:MAG: hypothetical protein A2X00_06100 [Bacteroidetes bacterium GWE2_32_14]OFY04773.1 MAG: hypothetical protein A2W99_14170 [Bacteroidetes bacterium GWF2_33_16]
MITSYIQELLATNNRVIIPNYGAFLVRATSKGKDSNNLEEKLSDVYFSPFLKFNDELLERFITKKESISKEQAAEKIKNFIEEIKEKLSAESPYNIKDFGQFTMDKQGKVQFLPIVKEVSEIQKEEVTETKKQTAKTAKEPAKKSTAKTKTTKEPEKELVLEVKSKVEPAKDEIKKEIKVETKPEIKPEEKIPVIPAKTEIKQTIKKKESSVNKGLVWSIAIGLPLAAIFIWALLNFDTINKVLKKNTNQAQKIEKKATIKPVEKESEIEQTTTLSEEIKPDQVEQLKEVQQPIAEQAQVPLDGKKYYLIAGSFKNEAYAETYLKSLREKGFPAEKLAERNGMYAVSFNSFSDKSQALAEYKVITQEKGLTVWILYY